MQHQNLKSNSFGQCWVSQLSHHVIFVKSCDFIPAIPKLVIKTLHLGKGPKIKKRESMVFDHTPLTPSPPNLNYGIFTQNF